MHQKYDLAGAQAWPPEAQTYLEELRREAFMPKPTQRSMVARWLGPALCVGFLFAFGLVAQLYLGHPTAFAANTEQPFESQTIIAPALILENPATPHQPIPVPLPSVRQPADARLQ